MNCFSSTGYRVLGDIRSKGPDKRGYRELGSQL
jgi:hypothetical protein